MKMEQHVKIDEAKIEKLMRVKLSYLKGELDLESAREKIREITDRVTAQEFAICEQKLQEHGISDDEIAERIEEIVSIFDGVLQSDELEVQSGHPIRTYIEEVKAIRVVLEQIKEEQSGKFIKNRWLELYEKLSEISVHFARKQNQLFPALEGKGFDKPSKVMWTLENRIRDIIKEARAYLESDEDEKFLSMQVEVMELVEDMMQKEMEILFPTALEMISDEEFVKMRIGDDEIGYCLIENPPAYKPELGVSEGIKSEANGELLKDLAKLLQKHGLDTSEDSEKVLDVRQGKLTLEQINLIFRHLKVDLSYVDENEIAQFYSDTTHRVFPRSPGVIGRKVENCHPRESVSTVKEIIRAFREGEQEEAEFWLEMGGKFIYIVYTAVRDDNGKFRGVLEMMQDATHVRSLEGSQRLLSWENEKRDADHEKDIKVEVKSKDNSYGITKDTLIGELVKKYPHIKSFMLGLSPNYSKLKNPILFKTMANMATMEMIASRGGFETQELIDKIVAEIDSNES
ncbi:hypothetical protein EUAN_04630 [Andreesenia angusta]|uniref:Hemerythrin HHE cation binding domain protein n=1 Tax=Andreesenia angusta TaxID=39480 RepID=A0A1S1VAD1_9FIRM|nr:PAS domain-containing protein [Andreesenia angusta]OHW62679.1 hypothetical protein EUAN_04630 [Andreesenia angusta]